MTKFMQFDRFDSVPVRPTKSDQVRIGVREALDLAVECFSRVAFDSRFSWVAYWQQKLIKEQGITT